jgi:DNA-binding transcriptional MerR regulator
MARIEVEGEVLEIPDKKYFTIGEVSRLCDLKTHVLRYWESVFPQLKPVKRSGRRYYQHKDIQLVLEIRHMLHRQGFTIQGAKAQLARRHRDFRNDASVPEVLTRLAEVRAQLADFDGWLDTIARD